MNKKRKILATVAITTLGTFGTAATVSGHSGATGVVKERMEVMERYEELADRLFAMAHGELPYSAEVVRKAASEIRETSGDQLAKLFPEGSRQDPSTASEEIWREFETFAHFADMLQDFAGLLEANAGPPSDPSLLPRKWEDVPAMGGMMRGEGAQRGGAMMGRGMMGGQNAASLEAGLWRIAHTCNTCHEQFRDD